MSSLEQIPEDVLTHLRAALAQDVHEQAVPDAFTVRRNSAGGVVPYYAVQFGDPQAQGTRSMGGARGDDYVMPIYTQAVASDASVARRMGFRMTDVLLGTDIPSGAEVRKRAGGAMFPIVSSTGAAEAYMWPASFGLLIQIIDDPTP